MLKYSLYILCLFFMMGCQNTKSTSANEGVRPNLFLFLADDLGEADLGINGNPFVKTQDIDAFAKKAISFNKMYTPSAMCAPSRSALMTGLYPHRNGCHMNHGKVFDHVKSLPQYLKPLGYEVILVGKRHIKPAKVFDYTYIKFKELDAYLKTVQKPVCIMYASNDPHGPHQYGKHSIEKVIIPKKWQDTKGTRNKLAGYYADIASLNNEFQKLLNIIKNNELDKKSVTIFTSDHGADFFAKWSCYEAGLKVPFFLQANGVKFKVKEVNKLTSFVDIVPTFIELAGGTPSQDLDGRSLVNLLKGRKKAVHPYIYAAHTTRGIYSGKAYPIRSITDGKWKYITNLNHTTAFQNIITHGWNFDPVPKGTWAEWLNVLKEKKEGSEWVHFYQNRPKEELYYLKTDPHETNNLADKTTHEKIKNKLSQELKRWMKQQNDLGMEAEMAVPLKRRDN